MTPSFKNTIDLELFDQTFKVTFPNIQQWLEIRTIKSRISMGEFQNYQAFFSDDITYISAVEAIATFSVLCGDDLRKSLNTDSLLKLPLESMMDMVMCYINEFLPWYNPIYEAISQKKKGAKAGETITETTTLPV